MRSVSLVRPKWLAVPEPERVGVVHHYGSLVFLAQAHQVGQRGDVALHRVHAVHDDEFRGVAGGEPEFLLQVRHVVVAELAHLAETQAAAVDDAGVVQGVQEDESAAEAQASHDAQVHLETGAVGHRGLLAHELGELRLQLFVEVEGAVEEAAAGAAGAVFLYRFDGGLLETGVVGKSQIGVGAEHQDLGAVSHGDEGVLTGGDGAVVGIDTQALGLFCALVLGAELIQDFLHFGRF